MCGNIGIHVWNGRIPGFSLSKYDGWAGYIDRNTGDIRPNAFFQEASYVGINLSVAFAHLDSDLSGQRMSSSKYRLLGYIFCLMSVMSGNVSLVVGLLNMRRFLMYIHIAIFGSLHC